MKTKNIALGAIIVVLTVILSYIPITIGPVRLAVLMLLPTLVISQVKSFAHSLFASLVLGLMSLIIAFTTPTSITSNIFRNPMVSVFPRLFIGPCVYLFTLLVKKIKVSDNIKSKKSYQYLTISIASAIGTIVNTTMVVLMMWIFYRYKQFIDTVIDRNFITGVILANFALELLILTIITPPVVVASKKVLKYTESK